MRPGELHQADYILIENVGILNAAEKVDGASAGHADNGSDDGQVIVAFPLALVMQQISTAISSSTCRAVDSR